MNKIQLLFTNSDGNSAVSWSIKIRKGNTRTFVTKLSQKHVINIYAQYNCSYLPTMNVIYEIGDAYTLTIPRSFIFLNGNT